MPTVTASAPDPFRPERIVFSRVGSSADGNAMDDRDGRLWDKERRKGEKRKWGLVVWVVAVAVILLVLGYGLARWRFEVWTSLYG